MRVTLLISSFVVTTNAWGQLRLGICGGLAFNSPIYKDGQGTQSQSLYGNAVGGYAGFRLQYHLNRRFSMTSEVSIQVLPYTNKFITGQFYPNYLTLSVLPAYAISTKAIIEAGVGSGLTLASNFENRNNNDPLLLCVLGVRIPFDRWGISLRYYRFIRPLHKQSTIRSETTFSSHGIQIGATYDVVR